MESGKARSRIPPIRVGVPVDGRSCGNCGKSYSYRSALCASKIVGGNCLSWHPRGVLNTFDTRMIQSLPEHNVGNLMSNCE